MNVMYIKEQVDTITHGLFELLYDHDEYLPTVIQIIEGGRTWDMTLEYAKQKLFVHYRHYDSGSFSIDLPSHPTYMSWSNLQELAFDIRKEIAEKLHVAHLN